MKKVLFVTYGGGHVNIVKPIAKEIKKQGDIDYIILALTTAIPYLKTSGLKYKTLLDYLPILNNSQEILNIGKKLAMEYHNPYAGFSIEQTGVYLGCSMYDLIEKIGKKRALEKFDSEGRAAFCPTSIMQQILKIEKPDIVVTTVPYRMEKAAVLEAKKLGIKTVFIHDLHFVKQNDLYNIVDANFVMNEFVRNELIDSGVPENKIYVTGQPAFDYLLKPINKNKNDICNKLNINPSKKIIVWIVDNSCVLNNLSINEVINAIEYFRDYHFILKLHPNEENFYFFKNICLKYKNTTILKKFNNRELLEIGDLFIVGVSTMGLEISCFGKDMLGLYINNVVLNEKIQYRYDNLKIALPVIKQGDLIRRINDVFSNNNEIKKFLEINRKYFWNKKWLAAEKCYELLLKI